MTLAILPIALVYSEISPLFHTAGGELIYNTVGFNRHVGFLASWLIMAAWISVPPAVVMAIVTFISRTFGLGLTFGHTMIIGIIILVAVFLMSMQDIQFLVKAQAVCLFANITTTLLTGVLLLFSGHWSFANVANLFQTNLEPSAGIPGWTSVWRCSSPPSLALKQCPRWSRKVTSPPPIPRRPSVVRFSPAVRFMYSSSSAWLAWIPSRPCSRAMPRTVL